MSMIHTETEAALLESARLSRQMAGRYHHAVEHLVDEGELKALLDQRANALEQQAGKLEDLIRSRELLPRETNTELNDLQRIADQLSGWLDKDQARSLARRFVEEEQCLIDELEIVGKDPSLADFLEPMSKDARRTIERLTETG